MLRGAYGYGTCFSKLVSHPFSQSIPMARKKKKCLKMGITSKQPFYSIFSDLERFIEILMRIYRD